MGRALLRRLWFAPSLGLVLSIAAAPSLAQTGIAIDPEESCVTSSCHGDTAKQEYVHAAAADGDQCVVCHEPPDESRHDFELVAEGGALCFNCHDEDEFADRTTHGPVAEGQCLACHKPHASEHEFLLKAEPPELCFTCHDRRLKDAKGRTLPSPKRLFEAADMKLHLPFSEGMCLSCHRPHASENYRLLAAPYPETLYASFSPDKYICFECHDDTPFSEPRTLTETGFRNGNLNLHYRHVNKKKGRGCKACHHHHGSANEKFIRDRVPFGDRFISIADFGITSSGGTCAPTCHRAVSYDRYEPVLNDMKVTPREGVQATEEELERAKKEALDE